MRDLTDSELAEHVERVGTLGYTLLENLVPTEAVAEMAEAFEPVYASHLDTIRNEPNRGTMRHYIVLPFAPPFYQSAYHGNPMILTVVRAILGENAYCTQFATDTPTKGSEHQEWHSDTLPCPSGKRA